MNIIFISLLILLFIGALSAIILFFISKKFKVYEDPLIEKVVKALPGVNCGGCSFPSCRGFALACINAESLDNLVCTVGKIPTMDRIGTILDRRIISIVPTIAVVRCGGSCELRTRTNQYDGVQSCAIAHNLYGGQTGCSSGCLGFGDCVVSCKFDAIHMNQTTLLPEIDEEKCTSCNACVKACPKMIIELRKNRNKSRRIYVNCMNKEKGNIIRKACIVACIDCGKCMKECETDAITITNNLAYIDSDKCTLCRKCIEVCPSHAIVEVNFVPKKSRMEKVKKSSLT